jgi:nitrogen regulatory protein PII
MDFMNLLLNYRDSRPTSQLCHSSTTFYYRGITYEQTLYQSNPHGMIFKQRDVRYSFHQQSEAKVTGRIGAGVVWMSGGDACVALVGAVTHPLL